MPAADDDLQMTRHIASAVGVATTAAVAVEKYFEDRQARLEGARVGV